jgi:predicted GNAT family N-acyltransferase
VTDIRIEPASFANDETTIYAIRKAVFIVEQAVPEEIEIDEYDAVARHVLAFVADRPVGTGRITDDGKIGRMAVLQDFRGGGVGREILRALIELARENSLDRVGLSAQCHAIPFYEKLGFVAEGPVYDDAGIDHRWMERRLPTE